MTRLALASLPALALILSACSKDEAAEADTSENAGPQGEVRGGTISDAMLPTAEVKSQSPRRGGSDKAGEDGETGENGDDAE